MEPPSSWKVYLRVLPSPASSIPAPYQSVWWSIFWQSPKAISSPSLSPMLKQTTKSDLIEKAKKHETPGYQSCVLRRSNTMKTGLSNGRCSIELRDERGIAPDRSRIPGFA